MLIGPNSDHLQIVQKNLIGGSVKINQIPISGILKHAKRFLNKLISLLRFQRNFMRNNK